MKKAFPGLSDTPLGRLLYSQSKCRRLFGHGMPINDFLSLTLSKRKVSLQGPALITWYKILDRVYKGSGKLVPMYKVVTDQAIFAPFMITSFMSFVAWGNGRTLPEIKAQLKADFVTALLTSYMIYPAVQVANFYILPVDYRPIVINLVSVVWNTYLCWKSNNPTTMKVPERSNGSNC